MILDDIVRDKQTDLALVRRRVTLADLESHPLHGEPRRGFHASLQTRPRSIIAEVKKASPSKGVIRADFDPVAIAASYARHGAAAISVLTEERYFQGHLDYLAAIRSEVSVPLLRKDFLFDPYQVVEARAYGADAILLIVAMLSDAQLREMQDAARATGLDTLVEVHDRPELERALASGARLIGINNRNLKTFAVSLMTTEELAGLVPSGITLVGESGIDTPEDIQRLEKSGVHVFLIGEALMRSPEPGLRLEELLA